MKKIYITTFIFLQFFSIIYCSDAKSAIDLYKEGVNYSIDKQHGKAEEVFRLTIKDFPKAENISLIRYSLVITLYQQKKYSEVIEEYNNLLKNNPKSEYLHNYGLKVFVGDAYFMEQKWEQSLEIYKEINDTIEISEKDTEFVIFRIGILYKNLNKNTDALVMFRKLINDYPKCEMFDLVQKMISELEQQNKN